MLKKRICSLFLIIIFVLSVSACNKMVSPDELKDDSDLISSVQSIGEGDNEFFFTVVTSEGKTAFNVSTNKTTVGEALKELNLIDGDEGEFGLYVKTVNSVTLDYDKDGKYWAFYINGEYAPSGVDKTEIKKGDSYMFREE